MDRLYSFYLYDTFVNMETRLGPTPASQADFHDRVLRAIQDYRECLARTGDLRLCAQAPRTRERDVRPRIQIKTNQYVFFIADLLKIVPRENVMFIHFDHYHQNRARVLEQVFDFLDLVHDHDLISKISKESVVWNTGKSHSTDIGPMWNMTRQILQRFYQPFNPLF